MNLSSPLSEVPRVGPVYQKRLKGMGILTARDLLFHFPKTYRDLSVITPVSKITEGKEFCLSGTIANVQEKRTFIKQVSVVEGIFSDATGSARVVWLNQPYLAQTFGAGEKILLCGKVLRDKTGIFVSNPAHEKEGPSPIHIGRIAPVYAETKGVSSKWLRFIIHSILNAIGNALEDALPQSVQKECNLLPFAAALRQVHFPDSQKQADLARERFSFEELFYISLFILTERKKLAEIKAPSIPLSVDMMKRFIAKLPFTLTDGQKKAAWLILKDMEKPRPMNRILQGDVGSGKTVVAAMAALACVKAGFQAAFLAPTEILARQHFKTIGSSLAPFKATIGLLTGSSDLFISPKLPNDSIEISRAKLLQKAKEGAIDILIGTHALIQDKVRFSNLALVVVDEQHRFGVRQRAHLQTTPRQSSGQANYPSTKLGASKLPLDKARGKQTILTPHFLSMTATPIPRTLAMTLYGDLDPTVIDELPIGRKPIETKVIAPKDRGAAYVFMKKEVEKGRQVFVICPRIEPSTNNTQPVTEIKTVKEEYEKLAKEVFPELRVAMLHGKMPAREKEEVMKKFKRGKTDILVSTSVVEVGVDIPNASVMMIEGADRFGLAQLHQFRGRVGRSDHQSYCFLFTESRSAQTQARLRALVESNSGFLLAEKDLQLRGPGDFAGTKQWGIPDFAMANLTNLKLVAKAREAAKSVLDSDISLARHPLLKEITQHYRERLHME
ncbi:MAG: ATP-dependent DNA helicase RecG [Candidatus Wildermuthbacteria bacterium]|nr:ATP-dependent DNA helicase RecG [Candidatus Wildermuthbacteria bacterium]